MNSNKMKLPLLEAAKWLCVALLVVFLVMLLSANRISQARFETVQDAVLFRADLTPMTEAGTQMLGRLYGLQADDYAGVMLYTPSTNMGAEELLLIKLSDLDQQETVRSAMEARIASQMDAFEGYGVDQYAMLEKAVVEVQGNYVLLVVAEDPASVQRAFLAAL